MDQNAQLILECLGIDPREWSRLMTKRWLMHAMVLGPPPGHPAPRGEPRPTIPSRRQSLPTRPLRDQLRHRSGSCCISVQSDSISRRGLDIHPHRPLVWIKFRFHRVYPLIAPYIGIAPLESTTSSALIGLKRSHAEPPSYRFSSSFGRTEGL